MHRYLLTFTFVLFCLIAEAEQAYQRTMMLMGCRFDITVLAESELLGNQYIDIAVAEISRIEQLISSWNPQSETSLINQHAGKKAVRVSPVLYQLVERSLALSRLTDGAFDISYAGMDQIWKFDGTMTKMPDKESIKSSIVHVGYDKIELEQSNYSVFLTEEGMKIGFGAIGKGYASDKTKELLIQKGVKGGIINASGDMSSWGKQANGDDWIVAITNPFNKKKSYGTFDLNQGAVVTSGNYEKFVIFNGQRYSHIIDPKTGYPATGILSVTVFALKAELADALATSVFVMGVDIGLNRINQLPNIECIIIDEDGGIHKSNNVTLDRK